ncbi:MAG: hypothetical protein R2701_12860 [Acidimicrobiales bacterium]
MASDIPAAPTPTAWDDLGGWPAVLGSLTRRTDLDRATAAAAMGQILDGEATPAQIAGYIVALRMKGETTGELLGMVSAMLDRAVPVELADASGVIDLVGTGGDGSGSINVSTLAALTVAGAGGRVCKHGNRAASSLCGTADLLEALGVAVDLGPEGVARCVSEAGMGFCLAPRYHAAMRFAGPPPRDGDPHRVQLHRPAGEPRPGPAPDDRGVGPGDGRPHDRRARGERRRASDGRLRPRRARRAHRHHQLHHPRAARRAGPHLRPAPQGTRPRRCRARRPPGWGARGERPPRPGDPRRAARPQGRHRGAERRRGPHRRRRGGRLPAGIDLARSALEEGRAAAVLETLAAVSQEAKAAESSPEA